MSGRRCNLCKMEFANGIGHRITYRGKTFYGFSICNKCLPKNKWIRLATIRTIMLYDFKIFNINMSLWNASTMYYVIEGQEDTICGKPTMKLKTLYIASIADYLNKKQAISDVLRRIDIVDDLKPFIFDFIYASVPSSGSRTVDRVGQ